MDNFTTGYFTIGQHLPGAATFTCALVFDSGQATGFGKITQEASPPLQLLTGLSGKVTAIASGAEVSRIIALSGNALRGPHWPAPLNVECVMLLGSESAEQATASLRYLDQHDVWIELESLPVQVVWVRRPH